LDRLEQVLDRIDPHDATGDDESDALAESLRLLDIVSGQENRGPGTMKVGDELAESPGAGHVDPGRGFIQKEDFRLVDDPRGDGQLAFHPLGIPAELSVGGPGQAETLQQCCGSVPALGLAQAIERRAEAEVLETGELRVEIALVWNHADEALGRPRSSRAVEAAQPNGPRVRTGQPREEIEGRGLAGAVGAEKTEQLSPADGKRQIGDGLYLAETLAQALNGDGVAHRAGPSMSHRLLVALSHSTSVFSLTR
jgi:hypothetical protein